MTRLGRLIAAACAASTLVGTTALLAADDIAIAAMRDDALANDTLAFSIAESLSTEVGPRLGGTPGEQRARDWAVRKLSSLGFSNVHVEPYTMPTWVRGEERAELLTPSVQPVVITALGNSGATPAGGIEADVVAFANVEELVSAPDAAVRGKIVFIDHNMQPTQDASSYFQSFAPRFEGPSAASRKGAAAIIVRSLGTGNDRHAHTGIQTFQAGAKPIPAAAVSVPDSEQIRRLLRRGAPLRMKLTLTPRNLGEQPSGNVVAEVPGTDPGAGIILVGGHLDSWDLGTGALDNASGIGILVAAAHRIMKSGAPRRTIRIVLFGAEEVGFYGGTEYFRTHHGKDNVVMVGESDFGAGRIWRMKTALGAANQALGEKVFALLVPLGVVRGTTPAEALADLGSWVRAGTAAIDLNQDVSTYFDYHHTANDTIDKVDPANLRQNVAAWTVVLGIAANHAEPIVSTRNP